MDAALLDASVDQSYRSLGQNPVHLQTGQRSVTTRNSVANTVSHPYFKPLSDFLFRDQRSVQCSGSSFQINASSSVPFIAKPSI